MTKFERYHQELLETEMPEGKLGILLSSTGPSIGELLQDYLFEEGSEISMWPSDLFEWKNVQIEEGEKRTLYNAADSFFEIVQVVFAEFDLVFNMKDEYGFTLMLDYLEYQGKLEGQKLDVLAWINS